MNRIQKKRAFKDPYSMEEITVLVEDYDELQASRSKPWIQVRLMDIDRAFKALPPKLKVAVLLCGFMGMTVRTAGVIVDEPKSTMYRRYMNGLTYLASYLNGGS